MKREITRGQWNRSQDEEVVRLHEGGASPTLIAKRLKGGKNKEEPWYRAGTTSKQVSDRRNALRRKYDVMGIHHTERLPVGVRSLHDVIIEKLKTDGRYPTTKEPVRKRGRPRKNMPIQHALPGIPPSTPTRATSVSVTPMPLRKPIMAAKREAGKCLVYVENMKGEPSNYQVCPKTLAWVMNISNQDNLGLLNEPEIPEPPIFTKEMLARSFKGN